MRAREWAEAPRISKNPTVVFVLASVLLPMFVGAVDAGDAYWGARHDPTWETRWRSLDPAESSWLAVMATSRNWMATLTDPEEVRLAKGRRSQESRRRIRVDLAALPVFVGASILVLAGMLNEQILFRSSYSSSSASASSVASGPTGANGRSKTRSRPNARSPRRPPPSHEAPRRSRPSRPSAGP